MQENISIPDARDQLRAWSTEWNRPELRDLADRMVRRTPKYPTARAKRGSLTPKLAEEIRRYKASHPTTSNRDIGEVFGVDGGRVSEAIHHVKTGE